MVVLILGEDLPSLPVYASQFSFGPADESERVTHDWGGKCRDSGCDVFGADPWFEDVTRAGIVLVSGYLLDCGLHDVRAF